MQLMDEHLFRLYAEGKINAENALDYAHSVAMLQDKMEAFKKGQIALPDEPINPDGEAAE